MLLVGLTLREATICDALRDMPARYRAVRAYIVGFRGRHLSEHRPADLHGIGEKLCLDTPRAIVARTTLHRIDLGPRHQLKQFTRLLSHVLHPKMTWNVI